MAQIHAVLKRLNIPYEERDYPSLQMNIPSKEVREEYPYQPLLYVGVEAGVGAMLGFRFGRKQVQTRNAHIIPFFGHTFNKDTWVPDAEAGYFFGRYSFLRSINWTSSFLGHDDNFGSDFCVPRLYVDPAQVDYVLVVKHPGDNLSFTLAETFALRVLQCQIPRIDRANRWKRELLENDASGWHLSSSIVLRAITMTSDEYLARIKACKDWQGNTESDLLLVNISALKWPKRVFVVEYSLHQLFPANKRKLGEIVFDATLHATTSEMVQSAILLHRMPGLYSLFVHLLNGQVNPVPRSLFVKSRIVDHVELFGCSK